MDCGAKGEELPESSCVSHATKILRYPLGLIASRFVAVGGAAGDEDPGPAEVGVFLKNPAENKFPCLRDCELPGVFGGIISYLNRRG